MFNKGLEDERRSRENFPTLTFFFWHFYQCKMTIKLCQKCKRKSGGHRLRFAKNMPRRSRHTRASLANNISACKPKNIAIKSSKWNVLCQILFKWTYQLNLVNWRRSLKKKFVFSDHSFTHHVAARWQDLMSRGQISWIFLTSHIDFFVHFWTTWR